MVKILMVVAAKGFRDEEYFNPKRVFEENGYQVMTASKGVSVALGKLGGTANVDMDISEIEKDEFDGIVFVGGAGAVQYQRDEMVYDLIQNFNIDQKLVAAICIAPTILAYSGVLKGKKATVWNEDGNQSALLGVKGADYVDEMVVADENIITGNGPEAAEIFAEKIVDFFNKK